MQRSDPAPDRKRRQVITGAAAAAALAGLTGLTACASRSATTDFRLDGFAGDVIRLGDARYEKWRLSMPWQLHKPQRYPRIILRPRTVADISLAVRFAASQGYQVAVKSGGHHVWSAFLRDGGVLLDLAEFQSVGVATDAGVARVQPSVWSMNLMLQLEQAGYAFPVAHCATVPMGGYLLGGGFGVNGDTWGPMACSNVIGATVIDSRGQVLQVDEQHHADLYWALRGSGPGFPGVVSEYQIKLFDRPDALQSSVYAFPLERAPEVVAWSDQLARAGLPKTEFLVLLGHNPGAPADAPPAMAKLCIARFAVFGDSEAESTHLLKQVADYELAQQSIFKLEFAPTSWENLFIESVDIASGFGYGHYAVDNIWCDTPERAVAEIADALLAAPSNRTHIVIQPKSNVDLQQDMAFSQISRCYMAWYDVWDDPEDTAANLAWVRSTSARMKSHGNGHYINEIDATPDTTRIARSFAPGILGRLAEIRGRYDTTGMFTEFYGGA